MAPLASSDTRVAYAFDITPLPALQRTGSRQSQEPTRTVSVPPSWANLTGPPDVELVPPVDVPQAAKATATEMRRAPGPHLRRRPVDAALMPSPPSEPRSIATLASAHQTVNQRTESCRRVVRCSAPARSDRPRRAAARRPPAAGHAPGRWSARRGPWDRAGTGDGS